jgi:hypothetical protein
MKTHYVKKSLRIILLFILIIGVFTITGCSKKEATNNKNNNRIILKLNTEGLGQVSYYIDEVNKMDFDDEYPNQSAYTTLEKAATVSIDAKADEGWKFVKWTKDGKEYSKDSKLDINITEDTELIAIFDIK